MVIGVDYGGTKIEAIVLTPTGEALGRRRVPTPRGDYQGSLDAIKSLVEGLEAEFHLAPSPMGIGTPGAVGADGHIYHGNSTWLIGKPLRADLESRLGRTVRVANDANCFALSEAIDGAGAGHRIVFAAIIGTGVGGALVVDGKIINGNSGMAGEWGHSRLPIADPAAEWPGPQCFCGRKGCVETWVAGPGLEADHARRIGVQSGSGPRVPAILEAADAGDQHAQTTLKLHLQRLARSLASVVNVLDPHVIVLGGGVSNLPGLAKGLRSAMQPHLYSSDSTVTVKRATFGDSSGVRGAARMALEAET